VADLKKIYEQVQISESVKIATVKPRSLSDAEETNKPGLEGAGNLQLNVEAIQAEIKRLRRSEFNEAIDVENKNVLIKYHRLNQPMTLPIANHEGHLQVLRYLQGILLIYQNSGLSAEEYEAHVKSLRNLYLHYLRTSKNQTIEFAAFCFAEACEGLLRKQFDISESAANKQVTMARDLGILLEEQPDICTISEIETNGEKQAIIEYASHVKVNPEFFDTTQKWYADAKQFAGLKGKKTWFDNFFKQNLATLKERGVCAPPSARWLPQPANCQKIRTQVLNLTHTNVATESNFIRLGTVTAFELNDYKEQVRLAREILKSIVDQHIDQQIKDYTDLYGKLADDVPEIFINYQTLLSPHLLETYLYPLKKFFPVLKDNNARFVDMASEAMQYLQDNYKKEGVKLSFLHTNAAVNEWGNFFTQRNSNDYHPQREQKLTATAALLRKVSEQPEDLLTRVDLSEIADFIAGNGRFTKELAEKVEKIVAQLQAGTLLPRADLRLQNEIALRLRSSVHLRRIINGNLHADNLPTNQRNTMMASLEAHVLGKQGLTIIGCKSARERTAAVGNAMVTQQVNPKAMFSWKHTYEGIIQAFHRGHFFRSLAYHVNVVKVTEVDRILMAGLDKALQTAIRKIAYFAKRLEPLTFDIVERLNSMMNVNRYLPSTRYMQQSLSQASSPSSSPAAPDRASQGCAINQINAERVPVGSPVSKLKLGFIAPDQRFTPASVNLASGVRSPAVR